MRSHLIWYILSNGNWVYYVPTYYNFRFICKRYSIQNLEKIQCVKILFEKCHISK